MTHSLPRSPTPARWRIASALALTLTSAASAASAAQSFSAAAPVTSRNGSLIALKNDACTVVPNKELFITHVSVVDDCWRTTHAPTACRALPAVKPATRGAWTFANLIAGIAGTNDPALLDAFVRNWLSEWLTVQTINGDSVPARPFLQDFVITPWQTASGGGQLDMRKAPFRLLAIVSRLDLRNAPAGYGVPGSAGEARFVFGLLDLGDPNGTPEFTVILEYGLDAASCQGIKDWASSWHSLGAIAFGDAFNARLEQITTSFTRIGASPGKPNGSAINQVRTDDFTLDFPWELREFRLNRVLDVFPAPLEQVTVAQTPDFDLQGTTAISTYVNGNEGAILAGSHQVPLTWNNAPFLGGAAPHSLELGWDGPTPPPCGQINNPEARFVFSLNTCQGCHGQDTQTFFYHVRPRLPGQEAPLSEFLTGSTGIVDTCGRSHDFNDLERRRRDLCNLLESTCHEIETTPALKFVH